MERRKMENRTEFFYSSDAWVCRLRHVFCYYVAFSLSEERLYVIELSGSLALPLFWVDIM